MQDVYIYIYIVEKLLASSFTGHGVVELTDD